MGHVQAHEQFKTFRGTQAELHSEFQEFAKDPAIQVKSISAMARMLSVGFTEGAAYPVHLEEHIIDENDLDASLSEVAERSNGDVICHSLYRRDSGTMACMLLVHKES